jgi:pilus assembly protein CpaF
VLGLREDQYVTNTLFRLDRSGSGTFCRDAPNPAGHKLRRD